MKKETKFVLMLSMFLLLFSCGGDETGGFGTVPSNTTQDDWLIPVGQVLDGGPGKDGIPSIDNPKFIPVSVPNTSSDDELVVVAQLGNDVFAYPHEIMDWHEIVNHFATAGNLTMTYCPLTGTAIGWDPMVNGELSQFGVSGLIFNSNLMPYDRKTNSTWSQMRLDCVNGPSINTQINTIHLFETKFNTFKTLFPGGLLMTEETGFNRNYGQYPYGGYKTNTQLIFPVNGESDNSLHPKTRILGIQNNGAALAVQFDAFSGNTTKVIQRTIGGEEVVIIGSQSLEFMVAFKNDLEGRSVNLQGLEINGESIAIDDLGNEYNAFGQVIRGPDNGKKLSPVVNYIGYWFAWSTFNPDIDLID